MQPATRWKYPIVDVDIHIHEDPHELAEFAEGFARRGLAAHSTPERFLDTPGLSPLTVHDVPFGDNFGQLPHVVRNAKQLRADMDKLRVDACILSTGRLVGGARGPASSLGVAQIFNRYLRHRWLSPADGIYGALMIDNKDPLGSAAEIEAYADVAGVAAIYLPITGVYPLWGHQDYFPIFAAAQAARLPVVLHGYTTVYPTFPFQLEQFNTALAKQVIARPFAAMANVVDIATTGVFARFPKLKVVVAECGISWLPFISWRLDQQYIYLRHEVPWYMDKPSTYLCRQLFATTHRLEHPDDLGTLAHLIAGIGGEERLMFASDWPHYDADYPERIENLPVSHEIKRKILGGNAQEIFKLHNVVKRTATISTEATPDIGL